jgi:hypothetical protein
MSGTMGRAKNRKKQGKAPSRKGSGPYSGIPDHLRTGTRLVPPMNQLPMKPVEWDRDLLPEFLWIAALADTYVSEQWEALFAKFLDALDPYVPEDAFPTGLISDFGLVPSESRERFVSEHPSLMADAFHAPLARILAFYPECPAAWLVLRDRLDAEPHIDPEVELQKLTRIVVNLFSGKDMHVGHLRVMPFTRVVKSGKLRFPPDLEVIELAIKYPSGCSDEEKYHVQQFSRTAFNAFLHMRDQVANHDWSKYFWRHNWDLIPCRPHSAVIAAHRQITGEEEAELYGLLERNASRVVSYIDSVAMQVKCDLYDPERDEVLLGLFSRMARLYVLFSMTPRLWARDISGIMLRCFADTAITFSYLVTQGTEQEFADFKRYGEGKEKLLMLHLQETYPGRTSLDDRTADEIATDLGGGLSPEMIDIELNNWTKKTARELAIAAGMEQFYRLVYDPTSSDVHGTWVSLKHSNLSWCAQPLHRFHRLPSYTEPPLYVGTIVAIQEMYRQCIDTAVKVLDYPSMDQPLDVIPSRSPPS